MTKRYQSFGKHKTRWIILVVLFGFLVLLHGAWGIYHIALFGKYEEITKDVDIPSANISQKDGLTFSVSKTRYLSFGGNLGIAAPEEERYLIIWPHLLSGNTYGFMMTHNDQVYNFSVDTNGNLFPKNIFNEEEQKIFEENKDAALNLLAKYHAWTEAAIKGDKTFFDADIR